MLVNCFFLSFSGIFLSFLKKSLLNVNISLGSPEVPTVTPGSPRSNTTYVEKKKPITEKNLSSYFLFCVSEAEGREDSVRAARGRG